ncbi:hypothetical protein MNBD_ALPHA11-176 [hydrothermal vent metagenome]|uniref:Uncharacterized protein n=1 Tax=hydrothermal vent metagenome TaxID=652676 RepID=A0A3B0TEN6_9ZZZZ
MNKFGYPITDTTDIRTNNFTTLIGAELHQGKLSNGETWHVLAVGLPVDFAQPDAGETCQQITDRAAAAGAFIGIVHPSWYSLTVEDARQVRAAHAIEIYNHGAEIVIGRGRDTAFLDLMLGDGRRLNGFATDDAHHVSHDAFGGWIHVLAEALEPEAILKSLKAGRYYSSQGPEIRNIQFDGDEVIINCSPVDFIVLHGRGHRTVQVRGSGLIDARFPIKNFEDDFFRVTIRDKFGQHAWSNPIWLD